MKIVLKAVAASFAVLAFTAVSPLTPAAHAAPDVEFDLPDGYSVSAVQMAQALMVALETADPAQRPLLLQALARVLEMSPDTEIADSGREQPAPVY